MWGHKSTQRHILDCLESRAIVCSWTHIQMALFVLVNKSWAFNCILGYRKIYFLLFWVYLEWIISGAPTSDAPQLWMSVRADVKQLRLSYVSLVQYTIKKCLNFYKVDYNQFRGDQWWWRRFRESWIWHFHGNHERGKSSNIREGIELAEAVKDFVFIFLMSECEEVIYLQPQIMINISEELLILRVGKY